MAMIEEGDPNNYVSGTLAADLATTTSTAVIAAQGGNVRTYLRSVVISNGDPTVTTAVQVLDGTTVVHTVYVGALAAGGVPGSSAITFDPPLRGTANTAWNVKCETTSAQLRATFSGFRSLR